MSAEADNLIHRLVVGDQAAIAEIIERAARSDDVPAVVAAALFTASPHDLMTRAATLSLTARDRQLVEIANAHLRGDTARVQDLARDHLVDHPDSVLVAWITTTSKSNHVTTTNITREDPS